jgi:hypothetical protein
MEMNGSDRWKGAVMGMNGSDRGKGSSDGDEWQ